MIKSYKECIWYMPSIDRCKMLSITDNTGRLGCRSKEKLYDFCIWLNEFVGSVRKDITNDDEQIQYELFTKEEMKGISSCEEYVKKLFDLYKESR